jgi:hypothetical protein
MKALVVTILAFLFLGSWLNASAQIINVPKRVENKVVNRVNNKIDRGIDKGLDAVEKDIKETAKDDNTSTQEKKGKVPENQAGKTEGGSEKQAQQNLQAYSNYDFVPGDKVLLYEDFSQDAVGDFPALWTTNKSGEINTLNVAPGNWLNLNATEGNWWFLKPIEFPKNFILEFDIVPKKGAPRYAVGVAIYGENGFKEMSDPFTCKTGLIISVAKTGWESQGIKAGSPKITGNSQLKPVVEEKVNHVIIWVQNRRVRIYHQGEKVLDMPTI